MANLTLVTPNKHRLSSSLEDVFLDFMLSREAMLCSPSTLKFYNFTGGKIINWLMQTGITAPEEISRVHIRGYRSGMARRGLSDSCIHSHARVIKTFLRFLHFEIYSVHSYVPDASNLP
jgi:site-specific recombinase XerD